jgi:hypothetical protein
MHNDARHAVHVSETLELAEQTLKAIIEQHERFLSTHGNANRSMNFKASTARVSSRLDFFKSMTISLKHRSLANNERLKNEINLVSTPTTLFSNTSQILSAAKRPSALAPAGLLKTLTQQQP